MATQHETSTPPVVAPDALQRLHDTTAVTAVLHEYCRAIDDKRFDDVAALFSDDAELTVHAGSGGTVRGRTALRQRVGKLMGGFTATSHMVSNVQVSFPAPDRAEAVSYLHAWHRFEHARPDGVLWGRYHDGLVRTDGNWKISHRTLRIIGEQDFPFAWLPATPG